MVIGLQSTGEARTLDVVAERAVDGELDDFVSGPKVSLYQCNLAFTRTFFLAMLYPLCGHLS